MPTVTPSLAAVRGRVVGTLTILLLAPVTAELLQAYLGDLGGPGGLVFLVVFFAPLYGGAALLIREVAERSGRGWTGRLLLAAGFGVAMPTIIDLSLFTPAREDIDDWETILGAASFGGIGWSAVVTWVAGHVLMSVAAPIVVGETLARRPGPWLGRTGLALVVVGFGCLSVFVHQDQTNSYPAEAGAIDYVASAAIVAALVTLAFTPVGRPLTARPGPVPSPAWCAGFGLVAMAVLDFVPLSWLGVAVALTGLLVGFTVLARWARSPGWTPRHLAAVAFGALLTRTITGFLAPLPHDTSWPEKVGQNTTYLVLVLLLGWALHRRSRPDVENPRSAASPT